MECVEGGEARDQVSDRQAGGWVVGFPYALLTMPQLYTYLKLDSRSGEVSDVRGKKRG